jgi:tyrosinase
MPHNPVHDLIGGAMATMQSPLDPIFYLHHANIDRLTHAWALPDGKGIPYSAYPYSPTNSDIYWAGNHTYATDLSFPRFKTLMPTWVDSDYSNNKVPTRLPPLAVTAQAGATRLPSTPRLPSNKRPAFKPVTLVQGRQISESRRSVVGAAQLAFDEQSVSYRLPLNKRDAEEIARVVAMHQDASDSAGRNMPGAVKVVVDRALLSDAGRQGGYFYALYLNMPPAIDSQATRDRTLVSTLGAFQIAGASHHGPARLEFDVTDLLAQQKPTDFSELSLSWVRVDGDKPPVGRTINVDEVRLELSYETEPVQAPPVPKPRGWYQAANRRGRP